MKILERKEFVGSIEVLVVLAMAAFAVMPGSVWPDLLVADTQLSQSLFKQGEGLLLAVVHLIEELKAIVGLHTLDGIRELFDNMPEKLRGRVGAVLLKCPQIPEAAVFINERVLIPLCAILLSDNTGLGDELHIDLYPLAGVLHLFVGLGNIL